MLSQPCQATPRRPPPFQLILGSAHHDVRVGMGSALILSKRSNSELLLDYTKTVVGLCAAIKECGDANVSFCFAVKEQGGISKAMGTDLARKTTDCAWKGKNAKRMPLTILTPFLLESVVCRTRRKSIAERWRPCCLPNHPWPPWQVLVRLEGLPLGAIPMPTMHEPGPKASSCRLEQGRHSRACGVEGTR